MLDSVILRSMKNLVQGFSFNTSKIAQNLSKKKINKMYVKFRLPWGSQLKFKTAVVCSHFVGLFVFEIGKKTSNTK